MMEGGAMTTMAASSTGEVVHRGEGSLYVIPDNRIELKGSGVFEFATEPGCVLPPHIHRKDDELHYLLEGSAEYTIGERTLKAGAGSLIFLPKQIVHSVTFGDAGGRWLWITDPINEGIAKELAIPAEETTPLPSEEEWDWERTFEVFSKYGMDFLSDH
jgi:quercetin dioxygenase-like cupin family protein